MKIKKIYLDKRDHCVTIINYHKANSDILINYGNLVNLYKHELVLKLFGPYPSCYYIGTILFKNENK
jgi:hypothetical protein